MSQSGRFVWFDMMSTDVPASVKFYSQLLGWKTKEVDMGAMGKYTLIINGERDIGGFMHLDQKHGAPSHWVAYMAVENVDAACETILGAGGKTLMPAMDIPDVGRFAVVADKEGAVFSPFKGNPASAKAESDGPPPFGDFCWHEVMSEDPAGSAAFYTKVFGYSVKENDMGPMGIYRVLSRGEHMTCGIMQMPEMAKKGGARPHWLHYLHVADVDSSTRNAREIGAKVYSEPMDIPSIGRFSVLADPTGAVFAFFMGEKK